jgi:hypothetical protein
MLPEDYNTEDTKDSPDLNTTWKIRIDSEDNLIVVPAWLKHWRTNTVGSAEIEWHIDRLPIEEHKNHLRTLLAAHIEACH